MAESLEVTVQARVRWRVAIAQHGIAFVAPVARWLPFAPDLCARWACWALNTGVQFRAGSGPWRPVQRRVRWRRT